MKRFTAIAVALGITAIASCSSSDNATNTPTVDGGGSSSSSGADARPIDDGGSSGIIPGDGAVPDDAAAAVNAFSVVGTAVGWTRSLAARRVYVAVKTSASTGNVLVYDAQALTKIGTIVVTGGAPTNIAIQDQASPTVYLTTGGCTDASGQVVIIDGAAMSVTKAAATAKGFDVGLAYGGAHLYANPCGASKVQEYDAATGAATAKTFTTAGQIVSMDIDASGQLYWFGNNAGSAALTKIATQSTTNPTTTTYPGTAVSVSAAGTQAVILTSSPEAAQLVDPTPLTIPSDLKPTSTGYDDKVCLFGCEGLDYAKVCYGSSGAATSDIRYKGSCDAQARFLSLKQDGVWVELNGQLFVFH
jgi:hypothetical protein